MRNAFLGLSKYLKTFHFYLTKPIRVDTSVFPRIGGRAKVEKAYVKIHFRKIFPPHFLREDHIAIKLVSIFFITE